MIEDGRFLSKERGAIPYEILSNRLYIRAYRTDSNRYPIIKIEKGKEIKEMAFLIAALSKIAIESFLSGATAAITLYCGVKTPRNRRK